MTSRSETVVASEPEQGAGELEQAQVVARLLVPADEDRPALREPRQRASYYSSARLVRLRPRWALVADERDVWLVFVVDARTRTVLVVVPLVQA